MDVLVPLDFADRLKSEWTKKELVGLLNEIKKVELSNVRARADIMEMAYTKFKNAAATITANIPSEFGDRPYFECVKLLQNDKNMLLSNLVSEAKKRSRMEWEDAVKTRTGKRPRRNKNLNLSKTSRQLRNKDQVITQSFSHIFESEDTTILSPTLKAGKESVSLINKSSVLSSNIKPAVASTPKFVEPDITVVPNTRQTRLRNAVTSNNKIVTSEPINQTRIIKAKSMIPKNKRVFVSTDNLQTIHGTPIKNPFELIKANASSNLTSPEIRDLKNLMNTIKKILNREEVKSD